MPNPKFRPPAPGDELYYFPSGELPHGPRKNLAMGNKPYAPAIVARVLTARLVDVEVTDADGDAHLLGGVTLLQEGDPHPHPLVGHCQWHPDAWPEHKPQELPEAGDVVAKILPFKGESQSIGPGDVGDAGKLLGL